MKQLTIFSILLIIVLNACQQQPIPITGNYDQIEDEVVLSTEVSATIIPEQSEEVPTQTEVTLSPTIPEPTPTETIEPTVVFETVVPTDEPVEQDPTQDNQVFVDTNVFLPIIGRMEPPVYIPPGGDNRWATVAGNSERTSWTPEQVTGQLRLEWYRPIEAYIPQNVQLITSDGLIFVATSRGLYALNAITGAEVWRFNTELPIGNSPTVFDGVVYFGGYDRKIHALRVSDGTKLWSYDGAKAGFSTNPLVVDGRVIAGNRDGWMYAIGANGTPQQGQLLWKFQTGGMIDLSAAYKDGVVYFASNDNYAYALRADNGTMVWKSAKLPGDGYQSYWPVIYQDKVIFSAASGYRTGLNPGTNSIKDSAGNDIGKVFDLESQDVFAGLGFGALIGSPVSGQTWANGKQVLDASRILNYHESKPWRRVFVVLNRSDGREFTFDSDRDGRAEYMPGLFWGTHSGNRYPPAIGQDGIIYFSNTLSNGDIPQGRVMGWLPGLPYLSQVGGQGAIDEPQAISIGGTQIYRNLCCDRVGDYFGTTNNQNYSLWAYHTVLSVQAPGYDVMWHGVVQGDSVRLMGNYGTSNGIYNSHGDQNPLIPYFGRVYAHRSNGIVAYGVANGPGRLPLLRINPVVDTLSTPSVEELRGRLETEVQKILAAGHLRPGYYNAGQFSNYSQLANYFENPGDTLYTLSAAYPHLTPNTQNQVREYLRGYFQNYFSTSMIARIGWSTGGAREAMPIPPEVQSAFAGFPPTQGSESRWSWQYPPFNFYALWKYAQIVPGDAVTAYNLAKSKLVVPLPSIVTNDLLVQRPYEHNAYIAGYYGYLRLQELSNMTNDPQGKRTEVTNELNRLMSLRAANFTKDTYYQIGVGSYMLRTLNVSRNFIFMIPELGDYLNQNARSRVQDAVNEYNFTGPYWFVARFNGVVNEGVRQNLYDYSAVFQAKAMILKQSRAELTKYLDVPAFERGDLFYIQNLVSAIQAP